MRERGADGFYFRPQTSRGRGRKTEVVSLPQRWGGTRSLEACIKGRRGSKYSAPGHRFQSAASKKVESGPVGEVGGGNAGPEAGEHPSEVYDDGTNTFFW
uniref:Uncharacterized protein n=1 Tax=Meleagris gallopavo TaxID=9103 RepID=A0A803XQ01_MELGA